MRRARLEIGALLVVVAALSGCVGIPTSGGVQVGDVISDQSDPDFIVRPAAPRAGSTPEELLTDFMLALRGPQNDYATARLYLTNELDSRWEPDANTLVRTGIPSIAEGGTENTLTYTVTTEAQVDSSGVYTEFDAPTQSTLDFSFEQVDGEWRISEAGDGIVLSQQSFNIVFAEQPLYFFDPSHQFLVPDVRWFPSRPSTSSAVVRALLAGPSPWLQGGVVLTAFPSGTALDTSTASPGVTIDSGAATVRLSNQAITASLVDRDYMTQQLSATLGTASVEMTVTGAALTTTQQGTQAVINPRVEPRMLVGSDGAFGFDNGEGLTPIPVLSDTITGAGATQATLAADRRSAAILTPGGVYVADDNGDLVQVDARAGLIAPSIDPFRFVWSAQGASAATLSTFEVDGTPHSVQSGLPADASIVSLDVSRDGSRLLVYLASPVGPKLIIAGIIRDADFAPIRLGELQELPISDATPIDATWVSDRLVSALSRTSDVSPVTTFEIGGPSAPTGQLPDATAITGGTGGTDGLRVLRAAGEVWRPQGSSWVGTGVSASFLATKQ